MAVSPAREPPDKCPACRADPRNGVGKPPSAMNRVTEVAWLNEEGMSGSLQSEGVEAPVTLLHTELEEGNWR
jgi:hypothetical protein